MSEALCQLDDIEDGGSSGFIALGKALLVVRQGHTVHVYENSCPHIGAPMDFVPGQFLNVEKTHIQCSTHGALFEIGSGLCVHGPCTGDHLKPFKAVVIDGAVIIDAID